MIKQNQWNSFSSVTAAYLSFCNNQWKFGFHKNQSSLSFDTNQSGSLMGVTSARLCCYKNQWALYIGTILLLEKPTRNELLQKPIEYILVQNISMFKPLQEPIRLELLREPMRYIFVHYIRMAELFQEEPVRCELPYQPIRFILQYHTTRVSKAPTRTNELLEEPIRLELPQ